MADGASACELWRCAAGVMTVAAVLAQLLGNPHAPDTVPPAGPGSFPWQNSPFTDASIDSLLSTFILFSFSLSLSLTHTHPLSLSLSPLSLSPSLSPSHLPSQG